MGRRYGRRQKFWDTALTLRRINGAETAQKTTLQARVRAYSRTVNDESDGYRRRQSETMAQ